MYGTILRQVILTYHTCSYKYNGIRYSIPEALRLIFFGASLLPFTNKDGGIGPVAIGLTLRRPIEKLASSCALVLRSDSHTGAAASHEQGGGSGTRCTFILAAYGQ